MQVKCPCGCGCDAEKFLLQKGRFPRPSCRRRYEARCKREGADPGLLYRILAEDKYMVGHAQIVRIFQHKGNNQIKYLHARAWMTEALQAIRA